jgi:hypothetical protein
VHQCNNITGRVTITSTLIKDLFLHEALPIKAQARRKQFLFFNSIVNQLAEQGTKERTPTQMVIFLLGFFFENHHVLNKRTYLKMVTRSVPDFVSLFLA